MKWDARHCKVTGHFFTPPPTPPPQGSSTNGTLYVSPPCGGGVGGGVEFATHFKRPAPIFVKRFFKKSNTP
jgi:hypothetical protein